MICSIPGVDELTFQTDLFSAGDPINIQLSTSNLDDLIGISNELQNRLKQYPGVFDIKDSFKYGKDEIKLQLRPEAKFLGISISDIAMQVRQAFYGLEVQSFQRGRDEIKVFLRYPQADRVSLKNLDTNEKIEYKIVGKDEADLKKKLIFFKSPIGKGLIGKSKGDLVEITTPNGIKNFEIFDVKYV